MNLPQIPDLQSSFNAWESEIRRLKAAIEQKLCVKIADEALRKAIHITNEELRAKKQLFDLNTSIPALITGKDLVTITSNMEFSDNKIATIALLDKFCDEMKVLAGQGYHVGNKQSPRVLLTGCPVGERDSKIIDLVEECGGIVVAMENCGGYKTLDLCINESDPRDPVTLLAEKYIKVPCSVMSPDDGRMRLLQNMVQAFDVGGVIDLTWQACHTYNIESYWVADLVEK